MVDLDSIERALLVNVVHLKSWNIIVLNSLTEQHFTYANRDMFRYVKEYADNDTYPDLKAICYKFDINDDQLAEYLNIEDLQSLCDIIKEEYIKEQVVFELNKLNEKTSKIPTDPRGFIQDFEQTHSIIKTLGFQNKTVGLFDNIENILQIDPSDVISTGFTELDKVLIGWKRGEELVTFMARTGQGKSWMGLKFAMSAAMKGEKVGIYSGEMSLQQLQERIICCAKPNYTSTKEESLKVIRDNNIDIRILTQKELRRRANINDIEEMIVRDNLSMLIVDQLSLMDDVTSKPGTPLRQQYGNISMDLFSLTSKYNLPCILLAQSNRGGGQQLNGPALENLAESDAVAQNSTRVISMKNENNVLTLNVLKNRYGESGMTQRYEVDFGLNKYRAIKDYDPEAVTLKRAKARSIFGDSRKGAF